MYLRKEITGRREQALVSSVILYDFTLGMAKVEIKK